MHDSNTPWAEIEQLARDFDRTEQQAARHASNGAASKPPDADAPVHISTVPHVKNLDKRRYKIGLQSVDRKLGPLFPGKFTVVGARIGVGKTAFGEQLLIANAERWHVMFATLEQPKDDIHVSVIARLMGVPLDEAERAIELNATEFLVAEKRLEQLDFDLWRPARGKSRSVDAIMSRAVSVKADMVVIDYAKYLSGWKFGGPADAIIEDLSQAAKETGIHVVLITQLKIDAHGKRPTIAMIQDTTRIEQEADTVLLLYRPFMDDRKRDTIAEVICAKGRRSGGFRAHVHWYGPMRSFYHMDEFEEARAPCCVKKKPHSTPTLAAEPREPPSDETPAETDINLGSPADLFGEPNQ